MWYDALLMMRFLVMMGGRFPQTWRYPCRVLAQRFRHACVVSDAGIRGHGTPGASLRLAIHYTESLQVEPMKTRSLWEKSRVYHA